MPVSEIMFSVVSRLSYVSLVINSRPEEYSPDIEE